MIDLSSFYQESGESWADMMDEENEDEEDIEKNNNKSHSSDCHDATDSNNKLNPNEATTDASIIEKENGEADVKEAVDENNKNDDNDKMKEYYENIESTIKRIEASATAKTIRKKESGGNGRGGTGGIVWRLPSEEQKKQQQEVIQRLVRQRQNIDTEDNWRRKPQKELDDKTQWRSNKPYRAPEKNNSKQWHLYSEELQVEYEEQVEESRKEFQRKFGTKSASNDNDNKTKPKEKPELVLPLADPVKPSILISADGPSDWADDIPDSDDEEEEEEEEEKEGFAEQLTSELKQELSHDATASSPDHSDRSIDVATHQPSVSDHFKTQSPQKNVDRIITSSPLPAQLEEVVDDPSPWISFAEQISSRSPALTTTSSVTPETQEDEQEEMEKDEQSKSEQLEEAEQSKFEESKEGPKDESKETKPVIFIQEDNAVGWNTFAKQSTSKWATTTRVNNDALYGRLSDNNGATVTQKNEPKQGQVQHYLNSKVHHQRCQSTSESIASNNNKSEGRLKDSIIQSPGEQILNHLSKNGNANKGKIQQQRGSLPSKTHNNLSLPSATISEFNTVPHHDSDDSINQHNELETLTNVPKIHDDVKNCTSRQDVTHNNNSDADWRTGATWNTTPTMESLDNDGVKSHGSWKNSNVNSSGMNKNNTEGEGASAAWTALAASNDDDTRSHGSRKTDNAKPKKADNDSWRGGTAWNHIPGTGNISVVDDDVKSHTSRASHTSRKSGTRSHFGNENERASAAWIAAGVQVKGTHSDNTRGKHETRGSLSEHDNRRYGSATWSAGSTMDNDDARSHSSYKSAVKKNGNGRTSDTRTSTTGNKDGEVQNPQGDRYNGTEQDDIWKESAFATWNTSTTVTSTSIPAGSESVSQSNSNNITTYSNVNDGGRVSVTRINANSTVNTDIAYNDTSSKANNEIDREKEKTDDTSNQSKWQAYAQQHSSTNGDRQIHARGHNNNNQRPWS
ncbi:hypothetical protein INT45_009903 [Circinella minor]|uniref:Uncharacterized protein n=1 Tax=Circinella minor TaxID=1195481 RepID=A0A8H7S2J4_9FUNG|nr:hypothetical protein INT45_009903 [Circinella minor]